MHEHTASVLLRKRQSIRGFIGGCTKSSLDRSTRRRARLYKMACWLSEEEKEAIRRSKLIDRQLQQEKKNLRQEIKILLLGAGESGKSTFIKQMRIIHGEDYSEQDRLEFRAVIFHNILKSMKILVEARRRLQIPLENPKNEENGQMVSSYHRDGELTDEEFHPYVDPLNALWKDAGIKATVKRNNEFQLVSLKRELD